MAMPSPTGKSAVETIQGLFVFCCGVRGNAEVCVVRCKTHSLRLEFGIHSIDNPLLHQRICRLGLLDPHESPVFTEINRVVLISCAIAKVATRSNAQSTPRLTIRMVLPPYVLAAKPVPKGTGHNCRLGGISHKRHKKRRF